MAEPRQFEQYLGSVANFIPMLRRPPDSPGSVASLLLDEGRSERIVAELEASAGVSAAVTRWVLSFVGVALAGMIVSLSGAGLAPLWRLTSALGTTALALLFLHVPSVHDGRFVWAFVVMHALYYVCTPLPRAPVALADGGSVLLLVAVHAAARWQRAFDAELASLRRLQPKTHSA